MNTISDYLQIEQRRYIGCKAKLTDWIFNIVKTEAPSAKSFCDIFAGTGIVASRAIPLYEKVIINDFLISNNIIYKAFFEQGEFDMSRIVGILTDFNAVDARDLDDNYFSRSFGGKYYDYATAKRIGYFRQSIEDLKNSVSEKENCILIATLIYNIDRIANTLGHFDAYIKKDIKPQDLKLRPINAQSHKNVSIFREDSNRLARSISMDVTYIDPPYNSRQYSRFYHLYETLVKWDAPELFGVALKPKPENMSDYCTTKAVKAFEDLIMNLDTRTIVVSYNNTYDSKSTSSENRISLEDIKTILNKRGETHTFEHTHPYFNAGKTEFNNHKEFLFVTKTYE